jgi:uncharacterized protein DUF3800
MHFFFIDESGTPPQPTSRKSNPYFIIAGVVMHETQWHGVASEIKSLCAKPRYNVTGEIKWRYFGGHNSDSKNTVGHLDQPTRDDFRREFFGIIKKRKSIKIIACCACVEAAYETDYVAHAESLYHYTYKPVSERFQYHLQDLSRSVGEKQLGIVVADNRGRKQDETFRLKHLDMVERSNLFISNYENFVESLFLAPSHHSVGVQVADMVAGAIGRHFNQNDSTFFNEILPSFRSNSAGNINGFGLVKFPKDSWK